MKKSYWYLIALICLASIVFLLNAKFGADDHRLVESSGIVSNPPSLSANPPIEIAEVVEDPSELEEEPEKPDEVKNTAVVQPQKAQESVEFIDADSYLASNTETGKRAAEVEFINADDTTPHASKTLSPPVKTIDADEYFAKKDALKEKAQK